MPKRLRHGVGGIAAAAVLSALIALGQEKEPLLLGPEHADAESGFALRPPADWKADSSHAGAARIVFTGPVPPAPPPTASVTVHGPGGSFDGFVKDIEAKLPESYGRVTVRSRLRFLLNAVHEAWQIEYTFTEDEMVKRRLLLAVEGERGRYVAQYTCLDRSAARFAGAFKESAQSFRLLEDERAETGPHLAATYFDVPAGFSVNPPVGWSIDNTGKLGPNVIFVGPKRPDGTVPNIVMDVHDDPRPFGDFLNAVKNSLKAQSQDFRIHEERFRYTEGGEPNDFLLEYSYRFNDVPLHSLKRFVSGEEGRKYSITCTAPSRWFRESRRLFQAASETLRTFPSGDGRAEAQPEREHYVNQAEKFFVTLPKGWTTKPDGPAGVLARFVGESVEGFRPEIQVVCDKSDAPLDAYVEAVREALMKSVPGIEIHVLDTGTAGTYAWRSVEFSFENAGARLRNLKFIIDAPGRKFIFNCGTREEDFPRRKKAFLDCVGSFGLR